MKQYYIYITTDHIHNKKYIGKRYGELDDDYFGSGKIITRVINKYGKEHLTKEILYISKDAKENNLKEKEFIAKYNAVESDEFYNIAEGGDGGDIFHLLPLEQQEELRKKAKERSSGKNNPRYGVSLSEETKNKIRENRDTSYMLTQEYRDNMSKAVSGEKNGMYGKSGMNAINGKHVLMYDLEHNLEIDFPSKTAALQYLNMKGHTGLDKAIKNKTEYKGHYWNLL